MKNERVKRNTSISMKSKGRNALWRTNQDRDSQNANWQWRYDRGTMGEGHVI